MEKKQVVKVTQLYFNDDYGNAFENDDEKSPPNITSKHRTIHRIKKRWYVNVVWNGLDQWVQVINDKKYGWHYEFHWRASPAVGCYSYRYEFKARGSKVYVL
jgi:hypothetical protein